MCETLWAVRLQPRPVAPDVRICRIQLLRTLSCFMRMQIVAGLDEGLLSMKPGGLRRMYIPGQLAYPKGLPSGPGRCVAERCHLCAYAVEGQACLPAGVVQVCSPAAGCTFAARSCRLSSSEKICLTCGSLSSHCAFPYIFKLNFMSACGG